MVLSSYARVVPHPRDPDTVYLYSLRTGGLVEADATLAARLDSGELDPDELEILASHGIVVPDPEEEQRAVLEFFEEIDRESPVLNLTVVINLVCNFSCRYCYQGTLKQGQRMDDATVESSCEFILDRFCRRRKKKLILDFYGGEPLLTPEIIHAFAVRLKPAVEAEGGEFSFTLVTNGSILTPEVARELKGAGLSGAKVTVDGPPDIHNTCRPYRNGRESFTDILENLSGCVDIIRITVSGNYSRDNFHRFPELLDLLPDYGLGPGRVEVRFNPVLQTRDSFTLPEFAFGCRSIDEPWLASATLILRREMTRRGYMPPHIQPSPCMVEMADSLAVGHDGRLYKCISMVGHDRFVVGDVERGITDISAYKPRQWRERDECRACSFLPLCFGGCRYLVYEQQGDMAGVDCGRTFFEKTLDEMIRLEGDSL